MRSGSLSLPVPIPDRERRRSRSGPAQEEPQNEHSALLPRTADHSGETTLQNSIADAGFDGDDDDGKSTPWELVLREFWILLRGSLPVIIAYALQNSLQTASVL